MKKIIITISIITLAVIGYIYIQKNNNTELYYSLMDDVDKTPSLSRSQYIPDNVIKINNELGGFTGDLDPGDRFARDHDQAGDINGDGITDLVVGARSDDDGATDAGAVYILFMNNDGTVQSHQKISMLTGGFEETFVTSSFFGYGVAGIGDYDGDGIPDIAASAPGANQGLLYIIHLNPDGTVKDFVKNTNIVAQGLSAVGDLDNDGRIDLVASDPRSDIGGRDTGAIRIVFLDSRSEIVVEKTVLISSENKFLADGLLSGDQFGGREVAILGDIDGDGNQELAVGSFMADGGKGAIWIISLDLEKFLVTDALKIAEGLGGFSDTLTPSVNPNGSSGANFGHALSRVGDLNGDGIPDLITGANQQDQGRGYILYLNADKTVQSYSRIDNDNGGFHLTLDSEERFSRSISYLGDLRADGSIAVAFGGGAGSGRSGSLYILFFKEGLLSEQVKQTEPPEIINIREDTEIPQRRNQDSIRDRSERRNPSLERNYN